MAARRAAQILIAAALLAGAAISHAEGAGLYLYQIPSGQPAATEAPPGPAALADLFVTDPPRLAGQLAAATGIPVVSEADAFVRVSVAASATLTEPPTARHTAASFVIDHDEPAVAHLVKALTDEYGAEPSVAQLIDFVYHAIGEKSYRRTFDLASQVAASGEGDCTEHAVLLAAAARATGKPARVVLGVLMAEIEGHVGSFGHAWAEIHDGDRWHVADATRPELELQEAWIRHLPLMELENEGPGYAMQLLDMAMVRPTRIELVRE